MTQRVCSPKPQPRPAQKRRRKFISKSTHALIGLTVVDAVAAEIADAVGIVGIVDAVAVVGAVPRVVVMVPLL